MEILDINTVFFTLFEYEMSYIEFWGTLTGAVAVWLSSRANVWGWAIGLLSIALLFGIFYQIQLYPDMFLQVFFFITNIISWIRWKYPKKEESNLNKELKISRSKAVKFLGKLVIVSIGVFFSGIFASQLNSLFPSIFYEPSAYPYADSFVLCFSIFASILMIKKKIESWFIWIAVDVVCTYIYYQKGVKFLALEYFAFCGIAVYGLWFWLKEMRKEQGELREKILI